MTFREKYRHRLDIWKDFVLAAKFGATNPGILVFDPENDTPKGSEIDSVVWRGLEAKNATFPPVKGAKRETDLPFDHMIQNPPKDTIVDSSLGPVNKETGEILEPKALGLDPELEKFIRAMRKAQNDYFKNRTPSNLYKAKELETKVDRILEPKAQLSLF